MKLNSDEDMEICNQGFLRCVKHHDAEVYPKISALVKLAQNIVTYNERN